MKSGDYLYSIANRFGITVQNLKDWNGLTSNYIYAGDVLNVSNSVSTPAPKPTETNSDSSNNTNENATSTVHVVKSGEWVSKIAAQYGVTDAQLRQWNNLSSDLIHPGDRLVVSKSASNGNNQSGNETEENHSELPNTTSKSYTVKSGDYLYSIATNYGVSVQNLVDWNNLTSNYIYVGDVLSVSKPTTSTPAPKPDNKEEEKDESSNATPSKYHTVKSGEWVSKIAAQYGITDAQLRQWNNLSSDLIHPGDRLVVSKSTSKPVEENNNDNGNNSEDNDSGSTASKTYTVKSGDYLYSIASRYGVTVQNIKDWNSLTSNYIYAGDVLNVSKPTTSIPISTPKPNYKEEEEEEEEKDESTSQYHTVKSGEWVSKIAAQYGITDAQLRQWNNLSSDLIHPGDRLVVSKSTSKPVEENNNNDSENTDSGSTPAKSYTVKSGDYLYSIASRYGVTVQNIIDWNNLTSNYLYAGDVLNVSKPSDTNTDVGNKPDTGNNTGDNNADTTTPDLSVVSPTTVNYDVKLNGKTEKIRTSLSYTGHTYDAVDYFGQRFTVNHEFVADGITYLELLNANGLVVGYVPKSAAVEVPQGKNVIYIDAGHGGSESGSRANGVHEKDLNLNITNQLSDILRGQGYIVYETRDNDATVSLSDRQLEPNDLMADAYISIHHNAMPIANTAQGIVTLYHDPSIDVEGYETLDHHYGTDIISEGKRLSNAIQNSLIGATGANDMGTRAQNLHVTRTTDMPATLVELGFQDHYGEFQKLINPTYQRKLINGLVNGINAYFGYTK